MKRLRRLLVLWADYRVSLGVLALAAVLCTVALVNARASSGQSPEAELEAGKLARQEASPDLSNAPCKDTSQCPPPPPRSHFINQQGFFELPRWDDRDLTDDEKAQDPRRDPFWPAFVQCLQDRGVGVGVTTPDGATQTDIDRLVAEVNESGPAYVVSPTGLRFQSTLASEAFLHCETILYNQRPSGVSGPDARR